MQGTGTGNKHLPCPGAQFGHAEHGAFEGALFLCHLLLRVDAWMYGSNISTGANVSF